jgi:Ca2+-transporting ATPase
MRAARPGTQPLFAPLHIAFLQLIIDPVCAIVFESEPEEDDVMTRPPRDPAEPVLSRALLTRGLWQEAAALAGTAGLLLAGQWLGWGEGLLRAAVFSALVACIAAVILADRSFSAPWRVSMRRRNPALWLALGATATLLAATLWLEPLRQLFGFEAPHTAALLAAIGLGAVLLALLQWVGVGSASGRAMKQESVKTLNTSSRPLP